MILALFTMIWMIFGLEFTIGSLNKSFNWIYGSILGFVLVFFAFSCGASIFGLVISCHDVPNVCCPALYCFIIFFLVFIPMVAQGGALGELASFSDNDMELMCTPDHVFHDALTGISDKIEWLDEVSSTVHDGLRDISEKFDKH